MKQLIKVCFCWILIFSGLKFSEAQNLEKWFPKQDLMKVGVYYYPEQWPKNQWERDIKNMAGMGFQFTHFAEFAWAYLEPEEGKYDFAWLDDAVDLAAKNGLKVIMCTPSAAPPIWLTEKYPETLITNVDGVVQQHGSREHCSWSSPKYRELNEKIVAAMAKKYGNDKRIWGWQIDNEPSHYAAEYDYSPAARASFINWLKKKYTSIEKLNEIWGTSFWSIKYQNFEQVRIPNSKELPQQPNPHAMLDFRRFTAAECADFVGFQSRILKQNISKDQWVTTNFMSNHTPNDPFLNKDLDFVTFTSYPVAGYAVGFGDNGFRVNSPTTNAFPHDYFRSIKGVTGIMELQPGQVNWGRYNPQPLPGAVRLWLFQAFGAGSAFVCAYRYRQPLYGSEQYHYGMVNPDGVTPSPGGKEYMQTIKEIAELKSKFKPAKEYPPQLTLSKTAILYSKDNIWETNYQRQSNQWNSQFHVTKYYEALRTLKVPVDFVEEDADFSKYSFLVVPAYQLVDEVLIAKLQKFADKGGQLILTCRFAQKDKNAKLWEAPFQAPLKKLAGVNVRFFDMLPDDKYGKVAFAGKNYEWNNWAEVLDPEEGTQTLATYFDQYYKSSAAVSQKKTGKGTVTYIGVETDGFKLEKSILKGIYEKALSRPLEELPDGLDINYRDGLWVATNFHSTENRKVNLSSKAKILIGEADLKPCGVLVWTE